jgi:hypothetical protein
MLQILNSVIQSIQPFMIPICAAFAWISTFLLAWHAIASLIQGIARVKRLHQIPCSHCKFFSGEYHLKCTIRPSTALSEDAINCMDYQPQNYYGY